MFDLLIYNGTIIDGLNKEPFKADLGIIGDKIVAIGRISLMESNKRINANGLCVTPGFIDIHTHSDDSFLLNPFMESKIRQGVTTEVAGNCGHSYAPLAGEAINQAEKYLARYDYPLKWQSMGEYLAMIEEKSISTNAIAQVGHGTIRAGVMGYDMRKPTEKELYSMKYMLASALEEGALGFSTGLIYPPSSYAQPEEIIELAKVVAKHDGIYTTHMRNEGDMLLESVEESIDVARKAGVRVEISHHKAVGKNNWGKTVESLALIDKARNSGLSITCDQYPYIAAATSLTSRVPDWAHEGGLDKMVERLKAHETSSRIKEEIKTRMPDDSSYEAVLIAGCRSDISLEGLTLLDIARKWSIPPVEVIFKLLINNNGLVDIVSFGMCEEDIGRVMKSPFVMIGSDAGAKATYGPLSEGKPHPRSYGTFPRVLGYYSRELKIINLVEAVYKMTGFPAKTLGLSRRGILSVGNYADITIFDPATVIDKATYIQPHQYPQGINYVIVNGVVTVEKGEHTKALKGRVIRRKSD